MSKPARTPAEKVFVSYKHDCAYMARQLYADLARMGCTPWIDEEDIEVNTIWSKSIEQNIQIADTFLVLWSPEIKQSDQDFAWKEFQLAKQAIDPTRLTVLRIAGAESQMPADVSAKQHIDFTKEYWAALGKLAGRLNRAMPETSAEAFEFATDYRDAKRRMGGGPAVAWPNWPIRVDDAESGSCRVNFVAVPWLPSGYAMSWRVGERDAGVAIPDDLFVVLKFTAAGGRDPFKETLNFLRSGADDKLPRFRKPYPQFLLIEGPRSRERVYEIPNDQPHRWHDCVDLCVQAIARLEKGPKLHFFLDAPQALTFPVASRLGTMFDIDVYNLERKPRGGVTYRCVFSTSR